jgi:hypothetical protein
MMRTMTTTTATTLQLTPTTTTDTVGGGLGGSKKKKTAAAVMIMPTTTTIGVVAVSARRAAAFELARDRLNTEATDAAMAAMRQQQKQKQQKKRKVVGGVRETAEPEEEDSHVLLDAFVRAHAFKLAAYEGQLLRPLPCEDSDDDALAAAREDAFGAHLVERSYERDRRRAALRRLRVAYARRALPRLHALRREAFALARLGERMRADAARIVGETPGARGYRFDVEFGGDLQAQYDHQEYRTNDNDMPGFADLLRAADTHTLAAERLVARARAALDGDVSDARVLVRPSSLGVGGEQQKQGDDGAEAADQEEALERLPALPCESEISDDDESDMSDNDEEDGGAP